MYFWATRNMEADDLTQFDARLWMPPKGEEAVQGPWTAEAEMSAFRTLKAQITGTPAPGAGQSPGPATQAHELPGQRRRPALRQGRQPTSNR